MRLPGYCTGCRHIKQVRVTPSSLGRGTPTGICANCERKQEDERKDRERLARLSCDETFATADGERTCGCRLLRWPNGQVACARGHRHPEEDKR